MGQSHAVMQAGVSLLAGVPDEQIQKEADLMTEYLEDWGKQGVKPGMEAYEVRLDGDEKAVRRFRISIQMTALLERCSTFEQKQSRVATMMLDA